MTREGTAQRCGCCGTKVVAVARPSEGVLEIQKQVHGSVHLKKYDLGDLVDLLDPKGTSFTAV